MIDTELLKIKEEREDELLKLKGITGVGLRNRKIVVYVEKPTISILEAIPAKIEGIDVMVYVTGKIVPLNKLAINPMSLQAFGASRTAKFRPAPGGVSIGHYSITAGSLGVLTLDGFILSNNHVISASNEGKIGDEILQPGAYDKGRVPDDVIGYLERFKEMVSEYEGFNLVDAAIARPTSMMDVSYDILEIGRIFGIVDAEVGDLVYKSGRCFTRDTLILTNPSGPKTVSELEIGDYVYSFNEEKGKLEKNKVIDIIYQGKRPVYEVKTRNRSVKVTENHPFLVVEKRKNKEKLKVKQRFRNQFGFSRFGEYERNVVKNSYALRWKKVSELRKGDLIVVLHKIEESNNKIGRDFAKFLGFFIGDGGFQEKKGRGGRIILYCKSKEEASYYAILIKKLFHEKFELRECVRCKHVMKSRAKVYTCSKCGYHKYNKVGEVMLKPKIRKRKNCWLVYFNSSKVARMIKELTPGKKLHKTIPKIIWSLPIEERLAFLEGYVESDGYKYRNYSKGRSPIWSFASPNKTLIKQIRELCITCGIRVTNLYSRVKKGFINQMNYEFKAYPKAFKRKFTHVAGEGGIIANTGIERLNLPKELELEAVNSIKFVGYEDTYDIEVENNHNFVGNGILLHNTTGLTSSRVLDIHASIKVVNYPFGDAIFKDQITFENPGGSVIAGGDSGSLAIKYEGGIAFACGLCFAGSRTIGVANKITNVMDALGISLGLEFKITPPGLGEAIGGSMPIVAPLGIVLYNEGEKIKWKW